MNVSQPWRLLRAASAVDSALIDLTISGKDEADWGDRINAGISVDLKSPQFGFGRSNLDGSILEIAFLGSDAANEAVGWTLYAWRDNGPCELIMDGTATLGNLTAETDPTNAQAALTDYYYADTITVTNNYAGVSYQIVDSGNERIAKLLFPANGKRYWAMYYDTTFTAATIKSIVSLFVGSAGQLGSSPDIDIGNVHSLNTSNAKINPATEDKQDDVITALMPTGTVEGYYNAAQLADAGDQVVDAAPGASNTQYVISIIISVKQECWCHFQDEDDTVVYGPFYLAADATLVLPAKKGGDGKGYYFKNTTNKALEFSQDSGHAVDYSLDVEFVTAAA